MRRSGSPTAVAQFRLPPGVPPGVDDIRVRFDDVATKWAQARGARDDLRAELVRVQADGIKAAAAAYSAGEEPPSNEKAERAVEAKIAANEASLKALDVAVDETGNALARSIDETREAWDAVLEQDEAKAAERFDEAIAAAREAFDAFKLARAGRTWLSSFDAGRAAVGQQLGFTGGRLLVANPGPGSLEGTYDPGELLKVAHITTRPEPERGAFVSDGFGRLPRNRAEALEAAKAAVAA
jgi:hypothetical protein